MTVPGEAPVARSRWRSRAGFAVLLAVVAVVGFWAGREIRQWRAGPAGVTASGQPAAPPLPAFAAGDPFPQVTLTGELGQSVTTRELLSGHGAAVLFLEPGCPACGESVRVWQAWIESGELSADRVIGISSSPAEAVDEYRRAQSLSFPIYRDADGAFHRDLGVNAVPLTVLVDSTGSIDRLGYEQAARLDVAEIAATIR